ncbi:MAG: HPr family phosphocarrier protein [Roseburia sp.]|nr:HPr family phosphocarrier protein [Roseburia sp.]
MIQRTLKINLDRGLEARPVAMLVQIASRYDSKVYVETEGRKINAKSIMGMMSLGLHNGDELNVITDGDDETNAIAHVEKYLSGQGE